jgi:hypothetical protein
MSRARSVSQLVGANTALGNTVITGTANVSSTLAAGNTTITGTTYANGSLGVGTSSPQNTLEVYNGSNTQIRIRNGGVNAQSYDFGRNGSTGLLDFYGNQTGYTGYTFGGIDGTRMTIDSAGRVTMPSQPSFEVSQALLTQISGENYRFTYSTIHHNVGSHYSASTGAFTAPVTGVYLFQAVAMGIATASPHVTFSINGATQGGGGNYVSNQMFEHGTYSQNANWVRTVHIIKLTAGDYIRVQGYGYSSAGQPERCYFGGHLLG